MGAIKSIEALRIVVAHVGGIALPNSTSISHVSDNFDDEGNCTDPKTERRIRRVGKDLMNYITQFID